MSGLDRNLQRLIALARRAEPAAEKTEAPQGFARRLVARWQTGSHPLGEPAPGFPEVWRRPLWTAAGASLAVILIGTLVIWSELRPSQPALLPTAACQIVAANLIP